MQAISIIKSEHKNLAAVLYSLDKLIEEIDNGKHPDFGIFHGLLTYIDRFLDRYHHPKENRYLFPKLLERAPETESIVRELGQQHTEGEILFVEMLKRIVDLAQGVTQSQVETVASLTEDQIYVNGEFTIPANLPLREIEYLGETVVYGG